MGFGKNLQQKILEELKVNHPRFSDKYISGKNIYVLLKTEEQDIFERYRYAGSGVFCYRGLVEVNG